MKTSFLIIVLVFVGVFDTVYATPEPEQDEPVYNDCGPGTTLQDGICVVDNTEENSDDSVHWGGTVFPKCSEQNREGCIDENGKFDYGAYWDSFWEPIQVQHSFEKNSIATFEHHKDELGFRGKINATQEDIITITVPRNVVDSIFRNCDPDDLMLFANYEKQYSDTMPHDGLYEHDIQAEQIANQTHREITFGVLPTMSFELAGSFPLGLAKEMFDTCGAPNGYSTYYAPPRFQAENGVEPSKVKCNDGLVLLQKHSGSPACVKPNSVIDLIKRNWMTTDEIDGYAIDYDGDVKHLPFADVCTNEMKIILLTHSNIILPEEHFVIEDVGLPSGMNQEDFERCAHETEFTKSRWNMVSIENTNDFDKTWGGPGNRHPAFWGYDIPKICTDDMIKHLVKYSTMFDRSAPYYALDWIGLVDGIDPDDFDRCVEELLERNPK